MLVVILMSLFFLACMGQTFLVFGKVCVRFVRDIRGVMKDRRESYVPPKGQIEFYPYGKGVEYVCHEDWFAHAKSLEHVYGRTQFLTYVKIASSANSYIVEPDFEGGWVKRGWKKQMERFAHRNYGVRTNRRKFLSQVGRMQAVGG